MTTTPDEPLNDDDMTTGSRLRSATADAEPTPTAPTAGTPTAPTPTAPTATRPTPTRR